MVEAAESQSIRRLVLCLVADEDVAERFPSAVRYLQIGLIDEPIDTILVVPEPCRDILLESGPAAVVPYRPAPWPLTGWARRKVVEQVRRKVDALPPDAPVIVHSLSASNALLAAAIASAVGGELVLSVTSLRELSDAALAPAFRTASKLLTPSRRIQRAIAASPLKDRTVEHVPIGVVTTAAPKAFSNRQRAASIAYVGALTDDCGVDALLRAVKVLRPQHPNLMVVIIGKGPAETGFRHLSQSLGLGMNVTFTGRLEQWRAAMEAADIFCLPKETSVFREEPIHALAVGLAIVAAADSNYEALVHDETALLFAGGDQASLAEHMRRLLEDYAFARMLAATAQARARSDHSIARMVADHVRIYQQLDPRSASLKMPSA